MSSLCRFFIVFLFCLGIQACADEDWKEDLENLRDELEQLENELDNQKKMIEALGSNSYITDIQYGKDFYIIYFSNGTSITLNNGKTPIISINTDGYWVINGVVTDFKATGADGHSPKVEIGANGHWWIDGVDTGVGACGKTPVISISPDGYWEIDGVVTDFKATGVDGHSPKVEIGANGHWWIDGVDTGVGACGKTPVISISPDGYWVIDGVVTDFKATGADGHSPKVEIGADGHWWIDGVDTGVLAGDSNMTYVTKVEDFEDKVSFTFTDGTVINVSKSVCLPFIDNNPLPVGCDTLRVLCLGNSYTLDAIAYLHELTRSSGIDLKRVVVYVAIGASTTLEYWYKKYTSGVQVKLSRAAGGLTMETEGTLKELLAQNWDVVCLQQKCSESIHYETFNPYLRKLIQLVRLNCPNQNLAFAWQMVWGYWPGHGGAPYGLERYQAISDAVQKMIRNDGIDIVIPIGTAIENARTTSLQTAHCITRDGAHLSFGVGRYIAACTWFQTILAPIFNKSVLGNPLLYDLTENDQQHSKYESENVTEENRLLCQLSAFYACVDRFHVTPMDEVLWEGASQGLIKRGNWYVDRK